MNFKYNVSHKEYRRKNKQNALLVNCTEYSEFNMPISKQVRKLPIITRHA